MSPRETQPNRREVQSVKVTGMRMRACVALAVLLVPTAGAISGDWVSHLYMNDIRSMEVTEGGIWCATRGGALFYDFSTSRFVAWNRTPDELASDSLTCVAQLEDGTIAWGTEAVGISGYTVQRGLWHHYSKLIWPLASDEILFIREDAPWRLIGSRGGVVALRDGNVTVTCQQGIDLCGLPGWDVSAGIYHDDHLWFGTEPGEGAPGGVGRLHYASGVWDTVNTGLPESDVNTLARITDFAVWDGELFCSTWAGVVAWTGERWESRSAGLPDGFTVLDLHPGPHRLLAAARGDEGGAFAWDGESAQWNRLGNKHLPADCVGEEENGIVWVGTSRFGSRHAFLESHEDGLWELVGEEWVQHRHDSPFPIANYRALTADDRGRLWSSTAAPSRGWWLGLYEGGQWSFANHANSALSNYWVFDIRVEGDLVRVGHCCCKSPGSCDMEVWDPIEDTAAIIDSVSNIWDSTEDGWGNLWFASYFERPEERPNAPRGLFRWIRATGEWERFTVENTDGLLRSNALSAVAVEGGTLWIGYVAEGVSRAELTATGELQLDPDAWIHYSAEGMGSPLVGDRISSLVARAGEAWIGTDSGISVWDRGVWQRLTQSPWQLPGSEVRALALTDDGAAWAAIRGAGVTRISRSSNGTFGVFENFGPPDLVSPDASVLAVGSTGLDVWVGTEWGLSHFIPRSRVEDTQLESVAAYPNPYTPGCGQRVAFVELPGSAVRGVVVDVSGKIVHEFENVIAEEPFWDGRDKSGQTVAPGLYIVRVATPRGWMTGRIAVVDLPCD